MIHDAPPLGVHPVLDAREVVRVLAEGRVAPDGVEVGLVQRVLARPVDLPDGVRRGTRDLVGRDPDQRAILGVQTPLRVFHVPSHDLDHVPCSADGCQPWAWDLA